MNKIKPIILLLTLVLFLTSCNFNDIFEPILEIPEVPTAELSEKPTNELITEEKTSETDEPEEELIMYFDPSPLLSDSTFQKLEFSVTCGEEFPYGNEVSYETYFDESKRDTKWKEIIPINGGREIEVIYNQTYIYKIWGESPCDEMIGDDIRIVFGDLLTQLEDFSISREERGYRPTEEDALKNAIELAYWSVGGFSMTDENEPYKATVIMNPISEDTENDGAGTVIFTRYMHGIKTSDSFYIKFNCDGIPYEMNAVNAGRCIRLWYVIDREELELKSALIDDMFGNEYDIGEKVFMYANKDETEHPFYLSAELLKTDESGNKISTRVYVPVERNDNFPLC